jgi:hypothetical protein
VTRTPAIRSSFSAPPPPPISPQYGPGNGNRGPNHPSRQGCCGW